MLSPAWVSVTINTMAWTFTLIMWCRYDPRLQMGKPSLGR